MYEGALQDLIDELGRLPGIGPKSAQRMAFHLLSSEPADVRRLAEALMTLKLKARFCDICGNVSEEPQCRICQDPRRDPALICVVEEAKDVVAIERTREFRGPFLRLMASALSSCGCASCCVVSKTGWSPRSFWRPTPTSRVMRLRRTSHANFAPSA